MSETDKYFDRDEGYGKRGLSPNTLNTLKATGLFLVLWAMHFSIFQELRFVRGITEEHWSYAFTKLPEWLAAAIIYGVYVPIVCSIAFGAMSNRQTMGRALFGLFIATVTYCLIATIFEIAVGIERLSFWKFYFITFPFASITGALIGRSLSILTMFKQKG